MLFAHDTEVALQAAAALVNTAQPGADSLPDPSALAAFVESWGWTGSRREDESELEAVRALRPRLRRLWQSGEDACAAEVNAMLQEAGALPQLVTHGDWGYHLHATTAEASLAVRMGVEAAMAFVDVVRQGELDRLLVCAADDCGDVLVDLSKNRSRRYCSTTCSNRMNVAAFRARRTAALSPPRTTPTRPAERAETPGPRAMTRAVSEYVSERVERRDALIESIAWQQAAVLTRLGEGA